MSATISVHGCSTWRRGLSSRKWKVSVSSLYRYSTVPALTYCTILARVTAAYNRASSSCVQRVKLQQINGSHHIYCGFFFMQSIFFHISFTFFTSQNTSNTTRYCLAFPFKRFFWIKYDVVFLFTRQCKL